MRLDKYLADMGLGTRKELKNSIRKGAVTVNGQPVRDPGQAVSDADTITFEGRSVTYNRFEYYMLNKPAGVVSATEDRTHRTVIDLLEGNHRKDLFPVGRLDIDTTGLLLLTNDGELAHRLLSPKFHVDKTYEAVIDRPVTDKMIRQFAAGIRYDTDLVAAPAKLSGTVAVDDTDSGNDKIPDITGHTPLYMAHVTIHEGKFHQVKKMFAAAGAEVLSLKRLTMGPLTLDPNLGEGEFRSLSSTEIQAVKSAAQI